MRLHSGLKKCRGLLFLLALSLLTGEASVLCCDVGQQVLDGILIHWHGLLVPVVEVEVEDVDGTLLLWVAHTEQRRPDLHALELIHQDVTALIALHDASGLPSAYLVQELPARDAYLAYEQLIQVVGG